MQLAAGTRLRNYEVSSLLGQGGMGEVYLAFDHDLERLVALKVLPTDVTGDENRLQRFTREARATSSLNHPNIAHVYAIGTENGISFMAMEYIEGETLRTRLRRSSLPIRVALDMAVQIAAALSAAHKKNIVHRDIKPENVMIRTDGIVKVVDFGLARSVAPAGSRPDEHITKAGSIVGTVSYMSPEQLKGVPVDPRSDIFSFGVVLYEMLTRHRPFEAPSESEKIAAILSSEPEPVTTRRQDLPQGLHEIVTRALMKDRSERYDSIDAMARDLRSLPIDSERVFADEMATAPLSVPADSVTLLQSTVPVRDRTARTRRRIAIALVAIAAILAVTIPTVIQIQKNQKRAALVATLDEADRLAGAERYKEAFALTTAAAAGIPADNVRLQSLFGRVSDLITVKSNPPGAEVSITHLDLGNPIHRRVSQCWGKRRYAMSASLEGIIFFLSGRKGMRRWRCH